MFEHFAPRVKGMMVKAGAADDVADEIVQDVFLTVWRKADRFDAERGAAGAWIFTIARNARIDRLRRGSVRAYEDLDGLELAGDDGDGETHLDARQRADHVAAALAALPEDQRAIIECAYVEDMSQSEIADRFALPLGTVKSRMRLAYAKLKSALEGLK